MDLCSIYLKQFRNYSEAFYEFSPHLNLICGPNARGKTSLLEAIHILMFGRSFRPGIQQDLILKGCNSFYLEAIFTKQGIDQKLRFYLEDQQRKILHNSTTLQSIANLYGLIQGVIMTPDDVNLIKGPPPLRRAFLDMQLAQVDPLYMHHLARYAKAIRQRNQLLKQKKLQTIESWENEMAQSAAYIVSQRDKSLKDLEKHCRHFYQLITNENEHLQLQYSSNASIQTVPFFLKQLEQNRSREMHIGYTIAGPHKDDIWIGIGDRDARTFASEGQQRSCAAALHLAEWQWLKEATGELPLFMIDDFGISLDSTRRQRFLDLLFSLGQVFLTTTDTEMVHSLDRPKKVISL